MPKEKKVNLNVSINKNIRVAIENIAEESHMSVSQVTEMVLFEGLNSYYELANNMMKGD